MVLSSTPLTRSGRFRIRAEQPDVGVLVLSQHVRASYALELLSDGTDGVGYLLKERVSDLAELAYAVERIGQEQDGPPPPLTPQRLISGLKASDSKPRWCPKLAS